MHRIPRRFATSLPLETEGIRVRRMDWIRDIYARCGLPPGAPPRPNPLTGFPGVPMGAEVLQPPGGMGKTFTIGAEFTIPPAGLPNVRTRLLSFDPKAGQAPMLVELLGIRVTTEQTAAYEAEGAETPRPLPLRVRLSLRVLDPNAEGLAKLKDIAAARWPSGPVRLRGGHIEMSDHEAPVPQPLRLGVWKAAFRLLTFRITAEELDRLGPRHLALGLAFTWIVGIGRSWDDPTAATIQRLGLPSLGYIVGLTLVLAITLAPLQPKKGSLDRLIVFVALTAPPGILYAIPVEIWVGAETAASLNIAALAVVAAWRLALALVLLPRLTGVGWFPVMTAVMVPICAAVLTLSITKQLDNAMEFMGGIRALSPEEIAADRFWTGIGTFSLIVGVGFLLLYAGFVINGAAGWGRNQPGPKATDSH